MDYINRLLKEGRLNEAFAYIENQLMAMPAGAFVAGVRSELEGLRRSYELMSQYMMDGLPDPGREGQWNEIAVGLLTIAERTERERELADRPTLYYNVARTERYGVQTSIAEQLDAYREVTGRLALAPLTEDAATATGRLTRKSEQILSTLFNALWTRHPLTAADAEALERAMTDEGLPRHAKLQWISATMLALTEFFDARRVAFLAEAYRKGNRETSLRALAALMVALWSQRNHPLPRRLRDNLAQLGDEPLWRQDVATVTLQFIRARDTERVTRKFNEEIIPGMMRLRPEIEKLQDKAPASPEELLDENPEWAEMLDKSGMTARLREMQEMQEDGADVMMATFSQLKSFPFFNEISNWFLPFYQDHSLFESLPQELADLVEVITSTPMFCDNDRYSVVLSLGQIPEQQRALMMGQLKMQSEEVNRMRAAETMTRDKRDEEIAAGYVRDLYRFFKLFRRKGEFADPFAAGINPVEIELFRPIFEEDDTLMLTIGEFYFKRRYMADALGIFPALAERTAPDATLYQKIGYCYEAQGEWDKAIEHYENSELLDSRSRWTRRHLALCYRMTERWDKALEYYHLLAEDRPDDPALALNIGLTLVKLRRFDEALPHLFKAEFLGNENLKSLRAIAWCTLLDGDLERAERYISKVLEAAPEPTANDLLNAGHVALASGHLKEAVSRYARSIAARDFDTDSFIADFDTDLDAAGLLAEVSATDRLMVRDAAIALSTTLGKSI